MLNDMKERINVAELLKDCPKGMELDCTMFEDVKFISVEEDDKPICIRTGDIYRYLTKFGTWTFDDNAKCVIFPKGKASWEGFVPPCKFKDGDIVINASNQYSNAFIYAGESNYNYYSYVGLTTGDFPKLSTDKSLAWVSKNSRIRFATEDEKEKLFKAIKDNGYKWNSNTKTLEKLIVPKFDIILLKPFDKVLVRDENLLEDSDITDATWSAALYSHNKFGDNACPYVTTNGHFAQCVPYKNNEHLLGTTDDCDEYYKTWE